MSKKQDGLVYYEGVGRRKESVARVRLYLLNSSDKFVTLGDNKLGAGEVVINGKDISAFFPRDVDKKKYFSPLILTDNRERFAVSIKVFGGGHNGQKEAIVHGIARALCKVDISYKPTLRHNGLLTRDPRTKERRKVGTGGKARRQKQSPKR